MHSCVHRNEFALVAGTLYIILSLLFASTLWAGWLSVIEPVSNITTVALLHCCHASV